MGKLEGVVVVRKGSKARAIASSSHGFQQGEIIVLLEVEHGLYEFENNDFTQTLFEDDFEWIKE